MKYIGIITLALTGCVGAHQQVKDSVADAVVACKELRANLAEDPERTELRQVLDACLKIELLDATIPEVTEND